MWQFLGYVVEFPNGSFLAKHEPTGNACEAVCITEAIKFKNIAGLNAALGVMGRRVYCVYRLYDCGLNYRLTRYGS